MSDSTRIPRTANIGDLAPTGSSGFQLSPSTVETLDLVRKYDANVEASRLSWIENHRRIRRLGSGGQGVVYLSQKVGADGFTLPVALKIFSPTVFPSREAYEEAMGTMAAVASQIALIQQDHLIDVYNVLSLDHVRLLEMEWIDGFDLQHLLRASTLESIQGRVDPERWSHLNDVILTGGGVQSRLKPGVAIAILRDLLAALFSLHRQGIVHGDIKPANVMIKKTGNAKLIDIGSAFQWSEGTKARTCTPTYAAPEVLDGKRGSPRSDLASLGYLLVEALSGTLVFAGLSTIEEHLDAKLAILTKLPDLLPAEVARNDHLMEFIRRLIAPNPDDRFPSAEAAEFVDHGAASFHRQLALGNLASEYHNEIRLWLQEL